MRRGSRTIATILATTLVAGPALADADPRPGEKPSDKDAKAAGELVKKAIARSQQGDHEAAIAMYQQAYGIVPSSALLSNIGAEYEQIGKPKEALKYFCMYLEKDPDGANAPYATSQARQLGKQLGRRGGDDEVCADTKPAPPPPPPAPARVEPAPEPSAPPPPPPPNGSPAMRYAGLAAGVAGLAALGVGIYEGVQAKNISDEVSSHVVGDHWPGDIRELEARGQHHEDLEIGFLIASGVLVTTGVVLYTLGRPGRAPEPADKTAIRIAPTRNGFAVLGRF